MEAAEKRTPAAHDVSIAIVGAGCRYPGGVTSLDSFDRLLRDGVDAIQEIPPDRWSIPAFASHTAGVPGKTYSRWGGFLPRISDFEPEAFGISAREAPFMDPQQRLLLEVVWEALEDASIPLSELAGSRTGVFVGISTFDYSQLQSTPESKRSLQSFTALGTSLSIAANRLSYCLDLRGPSLSVDTACSSALVALDRAVRSLQSGECDLAIACGVNALLLPDVFVSFCAASMLSPDGQCRAFDAAANGFVRAEGAGALVLRSSAAAMTRRDRVHARILGSGINQDGRTPGLAMPNGQAQTQLLREVYARLGIEPAAVAYVEAHGTGTAVGDPIEANAIGEVFSSGRDASRPLIIGSVKTNIGHLEAASGIAGVLKAVLSLKHRTIYRNLHFHQPNPRIPFHALKLRVPVETEPWPDDGRPRLAAVNSFGFGGTNAHVVLAESAPQPEGSGQHEAHERRISALPITARNEIALNELAGAFRERLLRNDSADITAFCRTAAIRRTHYAHRLCVIGETPADMASGLQRFLNGESSAAVSAGVVRSSGRPLVFVFSGQGSQYPEMGLGLLRREPLFHKMAKRCDETITRHLGWSVLREIERSPQSSRIDETHIAQPALFTIQVALAALWQSWGVVPSAVIGHSVGEVAAAWMSGALDLETACHVISMRSSAMQKARSGGKMAAVALTREDALERIRRFGGDVALAAVNSPNQVTVSGDPAALDSLADELQRDNVWHRFLQVSHAFHSPAMDAAEIPLRGGLNGLSSTKPRLRLVSTVTGADVGDGDLNTDYWWRNVRQPVFFEQAVRAVMRDAAPIFLEIGPHPVTTAPLRECARAEQARIDVFPSLRRDAEEMLTLFGSIAGLFTAGASIDWNVVLPGSGEPVDLPPHPWHRERYWHANADVAAVLAPRLFHPLLGFRRTSAVAAWDQTLCPKVFPWLEDHRIKGSMVVPGAAYVELMLAALAGMRGLDDGATLCLDNLQFQRALFVAGDSGPEVQVTVSPEDHTISIHSRPSGSGEAPWVRNAAADWFASSVARPTHIDLEVIRKRCCEPIQAEKIYQEFQRFGLEYGPAFRSNRELWKGNGEAFARVEIESVDGDLHSWWWHPTILDACFQLCCVPLPTEVLNVLKLPVGANHIRVWDRCSKEVWCHVELRHATEYTVLADIHIYSADGLLLAQILGFRLQRAAGTVSPATQRGPKTYTTHWRPSPPERKAAPASTPPAWIIFADRGGIADGIASRLVERGLRIVRIARGAQFNHDAADEFQVNPADPTHVPRVVESLDAEAVKVGVLYFWSLDVSEPAEAAERFADDTMLSVVGPLSAMRAVAAQKRITLVTLALVTRNARKVLPSETPRRANASGTLGVGRVAANEFPAWPIKLIDLPECPKSEELDGLADEILNTDRETESAWRDAQRFVPRLEEGPSIEVCYLKPSEVGAFRLVSQNSGTIDALKWIPQERRMPGPAQVEIEVQHTAINFRDLLKCLGVYPADNPEELALGDECAGVITATGAGVSEFQVGDRVACCVPGCFQSHTVAPAATLFRLSSDWSTSDAATIPIAFLTAWYSLRTVGRLTAGESVLIHSATGGVGMAAVQIAKAAGARIFATAGTAEKRRMLHDLGCELVMDSRSLTFSDELRVHTNGRGVDVVLNSLAGEALVQSVSILAPYGRFLEIGKRDLFGNSRIGLWPLRMNASFHAIDLSAVLQEKPSQAEQLFNEVRAAFLTGMLHPLPHTNWPASQVGDALRTMSQGKHIGKLVVDVRDPEVQITSNDVPRIAFRKDATYVVTGGAGGFGLETAKWIVRRGGKRVVLLSRRSPETDSVREALAELRSIGADPLALPCDVANRHQVHDVIHQKLLNWPPIRGVFHAATVMDDASVWNLDANRVQAVLRPKALGAWNLHEETRGLPIDHFVLFSSVSASIGNPGQASYAAANAMLEGLAEYRRSIGLPATAVGWGYVSDVGFAARQGELMKRAEHRGFHGLPSLDYLDVLERLLPLECETVVVGAFDWEAVASSFVTTRASRGLMTSLIGERSSGHSVVGGSRIREALETAPEEQRSALLRTYLQSQVARTLRVTAEKVDVERPIVEFGLDSLMGIELATIIERDCWIALPSLATSRDITVNRLVRDILKQMGYAHYHDGLPTKTASIESASSCRLITPLRAGGSKPPLICFHPIGGSIRGYKPLTDALDTSIPVFGVQSRMLLGDEEHSSLQEMAAAYTNEVQTLFPEGPCWLFGYSLGGYLAASVAQRLEEAGRTVEFIGVADCPDWTVGTASDTNDHLAKLIASSYQEAMAELPFLKPLDDPDWSSLRPIAEKLTRHPDQGPATLLTWLTEGRLAVTAPQQMLLAYLERMARHLLLVGASSAMPVVEGPLFVWQASRGIGAGTDGWRRRHSLPVRNSLVEADHAALMNPPAVQEIARQINLAYASRIA